MSQAVYTPRPMATLAASVLAAILTISPLATPREVLPGWAERPEDRAARYQSIASDVATAATDACGERGDGCRRWAVATLIGIAWHESGFAPDVDAGRCYRGRDGKSQRCDGGRAWSLWQLQGGGEEARLWATDRMAAAREALRRAGRSTNACRGKLPAEEALTAYAGGTCSGATARHRARELAADVRRAAAALP